MPTRTPSLPASLLLACLLVLGCALPAPARAAEPGKDAAKKAVTALKRALRKDDVAARKTAVIDVGRLSHHLGRSQQLGVSKILRKALEETEDDGEIRRLMIRALARMSHEHAWIPVVLASQRDRDPKVQAQARQEVLSGGRDELVAIKKILASETSAAFRAELLLLLRDRRKPDAAPILLERLSEKNRIVRSAAAEALEAISGEAHGYDVKKWKAWHKRWLAARPTDAGPSVSSGGIVAEPPPHVTRSLRPDFYGLPLTAKDIVFVIDISGSVGSGGFGRAKKQLTDAVALLGSDVHVAALFFSDKVHMWKKGAMVPASPTNKEDLVSDDHRQRRARQHEGAAAADRRRQARSTRCLAHGPALHRARYEGEPPHACSGPPRRRALRPGGAVALPEQAAAGVLLRCCAQCRA